MQQQQRQYKIHYYDSHVLYFDRRTVPSVLSSQAKCPLLGVRVITDLCCDLREVHDGGDMGLQTTAFQASRLPSHQPGEHTRWSIIYCGGFEIIDEWLA